MCVCVFVEQRGREGGGETERERWCSSAEGAGVSEATERR